MQRNFEAETVTHSVSPDPDRARDRFPQALRIVADAIVLTVDGKSITIDPGKVEIVVGNGTATVNPGSVYVTADVVNLNS